MTVPTTGSAPVPPAAECQHCTVPVTRGEVCAFCQSYTPPETIAQKIDVLVNRVGLLRTDGNEILRELPVDSPLFASVDLVRALGHLRMASVLLDTVSDALATAGTQR